MPYTYRRLGSADMPHYHELLKVFADAFEDHQSYQSNQPKDAYAQSLLARPDFIMLVALSESAVVGGLVAYQLVKFEQERSELYIYDLAVSKAHRRRGIATALIATLKVIAKQMNAYVIYVQADHDDEPAIKLYESLGDKQDVYHFDIDPNT